MFLNIKTSKAYPERALKYAIDKTLITVEKRNLITNKDPAVEMRETASRFGKWTTSKERKTFSIVISPNPNDNPTDAQVLEVINAVMDHYFESIQGIVVLHKDQGKDSAKTNPILHAHFYGSIIDPLTGKNIHLSDTDVRQIRAWADRYAENRFGWKPFVKGQRNASKCYKRFLMEKINKRGKSGWMNELKKAVEDSLSMSSSLSEFYSQLNKRGIEVLQDKDSKELCFEIQVQGKQYQVNATTLDSQYLWKSLNDRLINTNRRINNGRPEIFTEKTQLGKSGTGITAGSGARSGQGHVSQHKTNYACIFCTKDKTICRKCTEYHPRERDGHGSRSL